MVFYMDYVMEILEYSSSVTYIYRLLTSLIKRKEEMNGNEDKNSSEESGFLLWYTHQ